MLCAKYDYKMDIAVKKEEAFAEGKEAANIEAAQRLIKMNILTDEQISEATNLSIEQLIELKKKNETN